MSHKNKIISYIYIKNGYVVLNDKVLFKDTSITDTPEFLKTAYKSLEVNYPKFFKMDNLSKLAFLAGDVLLRDRFRESEPNENTALVFSNKASSLDTDRKHQETIKDKDNYYPSPAIFVYTLPNICLGEISIKYKLYSENSFFIFDRFDAGYLHTYANSLIEGNKADQVVCGWVDYDNGKYEAFLYIVSQEGNTIHTSQEIQRLYTTTWKS